MSDLSQAIEEVKRAKATMQFWENVKIYGSKNHALRALDCVSIEEAISMLSVVQKVRIFKLNGIVKIE